MFSCLSMFVNIILSQFCRGFKVFMGFRGFSWVFMGCHGYLLKSVWKSTQLNATWNNLTTYATCSTWGNLTQLDTTQLTQLCYVVFTNISTMHISNLDLSNISYSVLYILTNIARLTCFEITSRADKLKGTQTLIEGRKIQPKVYNRQPIDNQ